LNITNNHGDNNPNINLIIDHSNMSYYSNILLEFWDDYIEILSIDNNLSNKNIIYNKSIKFKYDITNCINKNKFNIKNIIKFIKNNIDDITSSEIENIITSFEFLNTFGLFTI